MCSAKRVQVAVRPHQLACARCGQAVPAVAVYERKVTPVLLAFYAVLLSSWRCAAAAPAAALRQEQACSEHRWPSSQPGQAAAAGLPRLLCTLLPHKLD